MSIRSKLISMFLAAALIPALFVSVLTFHNYEDSLEADRLSDLRNIVAFKADKIETYFANLKTYFESSQAAYVIKKNLPVLTRLARDPANPEFIVAKKMIDGVYGKLPESLGLADIMLTNPQGRIVYSSNPEHFSKDFLNFLPDPQQKAFDEGKKGTSFSDIFIDKINNDKPSMLLTGQALDFSGHFIGVIAAEVDLSPIYKSIQDVTGLGHTGETLIGKKVGNKAVFLNPLRHDPEAALKKSIEIGDKLGRGVQYAVQGQTGSGKFIDYRGKQVIGAWRHLPSLDWGVVAKIDAQEAYIGITNLRKLVIIILAIIFALGGVMSFSIAQSIAGPIKALSKGAQIIGSGNLDHRVGTNLRDEVGQLSRAFDRMTRDLKAIAFSRDAERKRLYDVLETLPVYVVLLTEDYHVPFANNFFRGRFGESRGRRCYEYLFKRTEPCENCETYKVMQTKAPHHWEWTGPDGRDYDIYDFPFKDTDGSNMIMEMGIDITKRKRAETELKQHRDSLETLVQERTSELQTILESAPAMIFYKDKENRFIRTNRAFENAMGLPKKKLEGRSLLDLYPQEQAEAYWRDDLEVISSGKAKRGIIEPMESPQGTRLLETDKIPYLDELGNVIGVIGFAVDITERKIAEDAVKESEKRLEEQFNELCQIYKYSPVGLFVVDRDQRLLRANETFAQANGRPLEELLGYLAAEVLPLPMAGELKRIWQSVLEKGEPVLNVELRDEIAPRPGVPRTWLANYYPYKSSSGEVIGLMGAVVEISDRKAAEETLRQTRDYLEKVFNYANAPIVCWDADFKMTRFNRAFEYLTDYKANEVIGKELSILFPERTKQESLRKIERTLSGEYWEGAEIPILRKNGEIRWLLWNSANVYTDDGKTFLATIAQGQDITERKTMEEALLRARDELESRVAERTAELKEANKQLHQKITELKQVEKDITARNTILKILGSTSSRKEYTDLIAKTIQDLIGCQGVGVRLLNEDGKIPYASQRGLSPSFCKSENWLSIQHDQCACIRVINQKPLPQDAKAMTPAGSFYSDNMDAFMAGITEKERKDYRGVCLLNGFASLAVIPIKHNNRVLGAIHLVDKKEGKISLSDVEFLESVTPLIGQGVDKFDLTERIRQTNELLEKLFANTHFSVVYLDPQFNFLRVNKVYAEACGYPPEFFAGKNHFDLFPHEENQAIFKRVVKTGEPFSIYAKPFTFPGHPERGTTYWDWSLLPVKNESGKVDGLVFCLVDVTKRELAEMELQKTQKQLIEAKRLSDIGTLAATVAHELRNPLAAIHLAASNMYRKAQNTVLEKHFTVIEKKINESDQIINNLLFYSRIRPPHPGTVLISNILEECIATARARYPKDKVQLEKEFAEIKKTSIEGDALQLKEVFSNILNNAFDALSAQAGTIEVMGRTEDSFVTIQVKDSGEGIGEEHLDKVFDPFFTTKAKGTGLGLSVCNQIVSLHGGTIAIASKKGRGTTVTVKLPVKRNDHG